jgi:hypothetical protein
LPLGFNEVPFVTIKVLENRNDAIGFVPWSFEKVNACDTHLLMRAAKVSALQKKGDTPASSFSNCRRLIRAISLG